MQIAIRNQIVDMKTSVWEWVTGVEIGAGNLLTSRSFALLSN